MARPRNRTETVTAVTPEGKVFAGSFSPEDEEGLPHLSGPTELVELARGCRTALELVEMLMSAEVTITGAPDDALDAITTEAVTSRV